MTLVQPPITLPFSGIEVYTPIASFQHTKRLSTRHFNHNYRPNASGTNDLPFRLHEMFQKVINSPFKIREYNFTIRDAYSRPYVRKRILEEITQLLHDIYRQALAFLRSCYSAFTHHPRVISASKFREDFVNLKVFNLFAKLSTSLLKLYSESLSKAVKNQSALFKIIKKGLNLRDIDFRKIDYNHLLNEDVLREVFKAVYYAIKIPTNIIDFCNTNPYMQQMYTAAGLGSTYTPFTGLLIDWSEAISPWMTAFKITSQTWSLKLAVSELWHVKPDDKEDYHIKVMTLAKAIAMLATEVLKIGIKISLVSATGAVGAVIVPIGSCSVAILGIWLVYKNVQHADAESAAAA